MSRASITPSVQRLAEENNVDWRVLQGSGEGGEVTETDVLEHLARVMRGEEALDPTPEPLPDGLSAWPEEPERRRSGNDLFSAAFTAAEPATQPAAAEAHAPAEPPSSPWLLQADPPRVVDEAPAPLTGKNEAFDIAFREPEARQPEAPEPLAPVHVQEVQEPPPSDVGGERLDAASPSAGVPEAVHQATLAELEALRARLVALEEERRRHVSELHQLSRMQETIALQKNEGAKLSAAQSEVQRLKAELAVARGEAQHGAELESQNRDLEARLTRARTFRKNAKAEYERLLADNMMLEHELAGLKKRRGFKLWGKS